MRCSPVEGEETVLCAGGIASPQLLLLSGVGPADHLEEMGIPVVLDSPGVGRNLRDHPMALVDLEPAGGVALSKDVPRIQTGLRYTAEGSDLRNDMQITLTSYAGEGGGDPIAGSSRSRNGLTLHFTVILGLAESAGVLTLASTNPADRPRIDYRYLEDEFDLRRMREATPPLRQPAGTPGIPSTYKWSRRPNRGSSRVRRKIGRMAAPEHQHYVPHLRLLQDGTRGRSDGGGGPVLPGAGGPGAANCGPVHSSKCGSCQYQCHCNYDRRARSGVV